MHNSRSEQNTLLVIVTSVQERLNNYKFVTEGFIFDANLLLEEYIESYLYGIVHESAFQHNHSGMVRLKPSVVVYQHLTARLKDIDSTAGELLVDYILHELETLCESIFDDVYEFINRNPWTVINIERYVELPDTIIITRNGDFRVIDWDRLKETYEKE